MQKISAEATIARNDPVICVPVHVKTLRYSVVTFFSQCSSLLYHFLFYYVENKNKVHKFTLLRLVDFIIEFVAVNITKSQVPFNNGCVLIQIFFL